MVSVISGCSSTAKSACSGNTRQEGQHLSSRPFSVSVTGLLNQLTRSGFGLTVPGALAGFSSCSSSARASHRHCEGSLGSTDHEDHFIPVWCSSICTAVFETESLRAARSTGATLLGISISALRSTLNRDRLERHQYPPPLSIADVHCCSTRRMIEEVRSYSSRSGRPHRRLYHPSVLTRIRLACEARNDDMVGAATRKEWPSRKR